MSARPSPFYGKLVPITNKSVRENQIQFWCEKLNKYFETKHCFSANLEELNAEFRVAQVVPECLLQIIELYPLDFVSVSSLVDKSINVQQLAQASWSQWIFSTLVVRPLTFSLSSIWYWVIPSSTSSSNSFSSSSFSSLSSKAIGENEARARIVYMPLLQARADAVLSCLQAEILYLSDSIFSHASFIDRVTRLENVSPEDAALVLVFLCSIQKAVVFQLPGGLRGVKIAAKSAMLVHPVDSVTDFGILQLKDTIAVLSAQIERIQQQIALATARASELVKIKQRDAALTWIRQRKTLSNELLKRSTVLENLLSAEHSIQSAQNDKELVEAFKAGTQVLKAISKDISPETVEDALEDLRESIINQQDIDSIIAQPLSTEIFDDDEIERELALLVSESPVLSPLSIPLPHSDSSDLRTRALCAQLEMLQVPDHDPLVSFPSSSSSSIPSSSSSSIPIQNNEQILL